MWPRIFPRKLKAVASAVALVYMVACFLLLRQYLEPEPSACQVKAKSGIWRTLDDTLANGLDRSRNVTLDDILRGTLSAYDRGKYIGLSPEALRNQERFFLAEPVGYTRKTHPTTMFVFVQSSPSHGSLRSQIRSSWGVTDNTRRTRVIFTMGISSNLSDSLKEAVQYEIRTAKDILLLNMEDSYDNLTYKGLLTMTWIASQGPEIKYIFKTDDDVVVNTFAWYQIINLLEIHAISCAVVGQVWSTPEVVRYGKWVTPYEEYSYDRFPSFCSGSGYLMTRSAMTSILSAAFHLPFLVRDDPYFTGIIRRQLDIRLYKVPYSAYKLWGRLVSAKELRSKAVLLIHNVLTAKEAWKGFKYNSAVQIQPHYVKVVPVSELQNPVPVKWRLPDNLSCLTSECDEQGMGSRDVFYIKA